jgi:hypothetical protein
LSTLIASPGAADPYRSRIAVLVRMTNVTRRYVISDVETIDDAIRDYSDNNGLGWETWCAHKEVPAWGEADHPHAAPELFHANRRLPSVCDGAVFHAHENGSNTLGYLYRSFVEAPHHPPVLVVAHVTERLSKAWEGQVHHHLGVNIERFSSDHLGSLELREVIMKWLEQHAGAISDGPDRRRSIEYAFAAHSAALVEAWQQMTRDLRRELALRLMLPEPAVRELIGVPIQLASLSGHDLIVLLEGAGAPRRAELARAAQDLDNDELSAWASWSATKPLDLGVLVLRAVVQERLKPAIANELGDLTQEGGWESFRRRWERGLAG